MIRLHGKVYHRVLPPTTAISNSFWYLHDPFAVGYEYVRSTRQQQDEMLERYLDGTRDYLLRYNFFAQSLVSFGERTGRGGTEGSCTTAAAAGAAGAAMDFMCSEFVELSRFDASPIPRGSDEFELLSAEAKFAVDLSCDDFADLRCHAQPIPPGSDDFHLLSVEAMNGDFGSSGGWGGQEEVFGNGSALG
jgi:hypothetical protein